jgi:hypothetical protein
LASEVEHFMGVPPHQLTMWASLWKDALSLKGAKEFLAKVTNQELEYHLVRHCLPGLPGPVLARSPRLWLRDAMAGMAA